LSRLASPFRARDHRCRRGRCGRSGGRNEGRPAPRSSSGEVQRGLMQQGLARKDAKRAGPEGCPGPEAYPSPRRRRERRQDPFLKASSSSTEVFLAAKQAGGHWCAAYLPFCYTRRQDYKIFGPLSLVSLTGLEVTDSFYDPVPSRTRGWQYALLCSILLVLQ